MDAQNNELAALLRKAADALHTQDAPRMMWGTRFHSGEHHECDSCADYGCVPVEPAPKAAASTSVDAPKCQRCEGRGIVGGADPNTSWLCVCGLCDGTGKAPAEPVKPRRWIIESTEHGGRLDGHLRYSGNNWQLERYQVVRELPTAPLDDAGLDRLLDVQRNAELDATLARCKCGGSEWHCEEDWRAGMRAVLREYAAMGYPSIQEDAK